MFNCMIFYTAYVCSILRPEESIKSPGIRIRAVINKHLGPGNRPQVICKSNK